MVQSLIFKFQEAKQVQDSSVFDRQTQEFAGLKELAKR